MSKIKKYKGPKPQKTECFSLSVYRLETEDGRGYSARARVLTKTGYIDFSSSAFRRDFVRGAIEEPPKVEAVTEVLDQAEAFVRSPLGRALVPEPAKYAILATQIASDATRGSQDGDRESRRTLSAMENSSDSTLRKAAQVRGLLEE